MGGEGKRSQHDLYNELLRFSKSILNTDLQNWIKVRTTRERQGPISEDLTVGEFSGHWGLRCITVPQ